MSEGSGLGPSPRVRMWRRQLPLLLLVPTALVVAIASSSLLRGVLFPLFWEPPLYLNPFVVFVYVFYVGLGLLFLTHARDRMWPFYLALVGFAIFVIAFVDLSMILWFDLQMGARITPMNVNPILIVALCVAIAATMLLHVNQLARRLSDVLRARGLDPAEIEVLEGESRREGQRLVSLLMGFVVIASLALWVADFIVGRAVLGLNVLGIMTGLLLVSVFLVGIYRLLSRGPLDLDEATAGVVSAHEGHAPRDAFRGAPSAPDGDDAGLQWRRG